MDKQCDGIVSRAFFIRLAVVVKMNRQKHICVVRRLHLVKVKKIRLLVVLPCASDITLLEDAILEKTPLNHDKLDLQSAVLRAIDLISFRTSVCSP